MRLHRTRRSNSSSVQELSGLLPEDADTAEWQPPVQDEEHTPASNPLDPPFLSLPEAAAWLGVSRSTVKRLIAKGDLVTVRVGARQKVPASFLAQYVAREILLPCDAVKTQQ